MNINTGNKTVDLMSRYRFEGNIILHEWYESLRLQSGKPDMVAMLILSEVAYWYRPKTILDEQTGQLIGYKKRFKADLLQKSYDDLSAKMGFSKKQIREALIRLEEKGVLTRVFRTIDTHMGKIPNVMFLDLNISEFVRVSFPTGNDPITSEETPSYPEVKTNTESTSKSTTKKATTKENAFRFYGDNFGMLTPHISDKLGSWLDDFNGEDSIIIRALEIGLERNKRSWGYCEAILKDWHSKNVKSLADIESLDAEKQKPKRTGKANKRNQMIDEEELDLD